MYLKALFIKFRDNALQTYVFMDTQVCIFTPSFLTAHSPCFIIKIYMPLNGASELTSIL